MNNFIFREPFLEHAVDWDNVFLNSGKFFLNPAPGGEGLGYIRVDLEVIEHVKANLAMMLEKDAFGRYVDMLEGQMVLMSQHPEINIPLGFNPDFDANGQPTTAINRVRKRIAIKKRLDEMQRGTFAGLQDPLFLCMSEHKLAMQEFVAVASANAGHYYGARSHLTVDLSQLILTDKARRVIKKVEWGPIPFIGFKYGFTFTFFPFCSVTKQFKNII